jgi:hypothetical protein
MSDKKEVMAAGDLIKSIRSLLQQYNETNKVGIERIDVECRNTSTLAGKGYEYEFHITFE